MKKILGSLIIGSVLFASCGKEAPQLSTDYAAVAVIAASPTLPTFHIYVDTLRKTSSGTAFRSSTGYQSVTSGVHNIQFRSSVNLVTNYYESANESFESNQAYTYLLYDTLVGTSFSNLKVARLTDDLNLATDQIKVRFVHLANKGGAYDVTFLRTSQTPADSVTISNQAYIGSTPGSLATLSMFRTIPLGAYTVKIKAAGTQTVLTTTAFTALLSSIYTVFTAGTAPGTTALSANIFRHYP